MCNLDIYRKCYKIERCYTYSCFFDSLVVFKFSDQNRNEICNQKLHNSVKSCQEILSKSLISMKMLKNFILCFSMKKRWTFAMSRSSCFVCIFI